MNKQKIGVIFGGNSPEYKVSLESSHSIITNINKDIYDIVMIGITPKGDWYRYYGSEDKILSDEWFSDKCNKVVISPNPSDHGLLEFTDIGIDNVYIDLFFPVLHGKNGEDGTVQGLIELAGIPYVGCKILSSSVCMDKYVAHELVIHNGIKAAKSVLIHNYDKVEDLKDKIDDLGYPIFVKPLRAGSSFGITRIDRYEELSDALNIAFKYDTKVVLEETIFGTEVGCAVLGDEELLVGAVDEIILKDSTFFDYDDKYDNRKSKLICPANISNDLSNKIREEAKKIYRALDCSGFARVDMFLTDNNEIYLNEVNTIPGCTVHSRFPAMLGEIGLDYKTIVQKLIDLELK